MSGGRHDHNLRKMKKWRRRRVVAELAGQTEVARLARAYEHWCAMRFARKRAYAKGTRWVSRQRRDHDNRRVQQAKLLILMLHLLEMKRSGVVPSRHYETHRDQRGGRRGGLPPVLPRPRTSVHEALSTPRLKV